MLYSDIVYLLKNLKSSIEGADTWDYELLKYYQRKYREFQSIVDVLKIV